MSDLARLSIARELREKAKRYHNLALSINDKHAIEIIRAMSCELSVRAREIEGVVANGDEGESVGVEATLICAE